MSIKILVADDDKSMLGLYDRIFSATDYSVAKAGSFAEASRLLREDRFDLLITDFMFPDGLGTELVSIFREIKSDARCVLVTGSPTPGQERACASVDCLLEKPFKVEELLGVVEKVMA